MEAGPSDGSATARAREQSFAAWIAGTRIVDRSGAPLRCYHGTTSSFAVFRSHAPQSVYYLDGREISVANSWDMGDDREGMPEGYHYIALSHALQLGPEEALKLNRNDSRRLGHQTHPDAARLLRDLERLQGSRLERKTEVRPSGDGFYFTPDPNYSFIRDIGQHEGGHVMPVYLAIRNPVWLNASQIEGAGASFRMDKYLAAGYDGAIFAEYPDDLERRGWNGSTQIVAFHPTQIKSAVGNLGMFRPDDPNILHEDAASLIVTTAPADESRTHPNPTNTAAFRAWFRESQIVDAQGKPLIVYHGTGSSFSQMDVGATTGGKASGGMTSAWGSYFSPSPKEASIYAEMAGRAPSVMPVYLSLQNPRIMNRGEWTLRSLRIATRKESPSAARDEAIAAGHDGIIVRGQGLNDEYIAFHPEQIKSAIGNSGAFDPNDPNILREDAVPLASPSPAEPTGPGDSPSHDEGSPAAESNFFEREQARRAQREDELQRLLATEGPVEFAHRSGRMSAVVTPSLSEAGKWRITRIDERGPIGHTEYGSRDKALRDAVLEGFSVTKVHEDRAPAPVVAQTSTQAFRRWFRNSHVIGEDGEPLVVYHGSDGDFDVFEMGRRSTRGVGLYIYDVTADGAFFSADPQDAASYGTNVRAFYLAVSNPLVHPGSIASSTRSTPEERAASKKAWEDLEYILQPAMSDGGDGRWYIDTDNGVSRVEVDVDGAWLDKVFADGLLDWSLVDNREVVSRLKERGYDGVRVHEPAHESGQAWFVVAPEQIKSATDNLGTFDPLDANILHEEGAPLGGSSGGPDVHAPAGVATDAAAFVNWFGSSKVVDAGGQPLVMYHGTTATFAEFDSARTFDGGFYFTPNREHALEYGAMKGDGEVRAIAAFLAISNPLEIDAEGAAFDWEMQERLADEVWRGKQTGQFDGIVLRHCDTLGYGDLSEIWVALYPEQIKSATHNLGTFDPNDTNILREDVAALSVGAAPSARSSILPRATVSASFRNWFGNSRAVTRAGRPITVFHATRSDFLIFDIQRGDLGAHFGTVEQANHIAHSRLEPAIPPGSDTGVSIMRLFLRVERPLRLVDVGSFHADAIASQLAAKGIITRQRAREIEKAAEANWRSRSALNAEVRSAIEAAGYDGVVYRNRHEGAGDSYIAFSPQQIKSALGNLGTFSVDDPSILREEVTPLDFSSSSPSDAGASGDVTQAPAFRRWFGDSKVVDRNGEPLRVFHGTAIRKTEFRRDGGAAGIGAYFTDDPNVAKEYADMDAAIDGDEPLVMSVYLSIANPYLASGTEAQSITPQRRDELEALGHDGVIATYPDGAREFIAFSPEQIKSAIGNIGAFSADDANILREEAALLGASTPDGDTESPLTAETARSFLRWFGDSQVVDGRGAPLTVYHGTIHDFEQFAVGDLGFHFGDQRAAHVALCNALATALPAVGLSFESAPYVIENHARGDVEAWVGYEFLGAYRDPDEAMREAERHAAQVQAMARAPLPDEAPSSVRPMIRPALLKIERPLRLPGMHRWSEPCEWVEVLGNRHIEQGTPEADLLAAAIKANQSASEDWQAQVRTILRSHGHDGIVYANWDQGAGADSWIALDADQIRPALARSDRASLLAEDIGDDLTRPASADPGAHLSGRPDLARAAVAGERALRRAGGSDAFRAEPRRTGDRRRRIAGFAVPGRVDVAGPTALVGSHVDSLAQLAELAERYRDPRHETFRLFYIRAGRCVHASGVSSRLPGHTGMRPHGQTREAWLADIRATIARVDADTVYMLHNHPSGDPSPSKADVEQTILLAQSIPEVKAHVIINSHRYARIGADGRHVVLPAPWSRGSLLKPARPHTLLGRRLTSESQVALWSKSLQQPGWVTLVGIDAHNTVRGVLDVSAGEYQERLDRMRATCERFARACGARSLIAYGEESIVDHPTSFSLMSDAYVRQVLTTHGDALSFRYNITSPRDRIFGRTFEQFPVRRLEPSGQAARGVQWGQAPADARLLADSPDTVAHPSTTAFQAWFADSKVVDADGMPKRVYHGGMRFDSFARDNESVAYYATEELGKAYGFASQYPPSEAEIKPLYLSITNPVDLRDAATFERWMGFAPQPSPFTGRTDFFMAGNNQPVRSGGHVLSAIRAAGHDGVIFYDTDVYGRGVHVAYAFFDPSQAKLAQPDPGDGPDYYDYPIRQVGNAGTYRRDDPNLLAELTDDVMGVSRRVVYHGSAYPEGFRDGWFSYARKRVNDFGADADLGFFFSESPKVASDFAEDYGAVVPARVTLSRPLFMPAACYRRRLDEWWGRDWAGVKIELVSAGLDGVVVPADERLGAEPGWHQFTAATLVAFDPGSIRSSFEAPLEQTLPSPALLRGYAVVGDAGAVPGTTFYAEEKAARQAAVSSGVSGAHVVRAQYRPLRPAAVLGGDIDPSTGVDVQEALEQAKSLGCDALEVLGPDLRPSHYIVCRPSVLTLQVVRPGPSTPALRAWMGASAVVTPDGDPLPVYHGTGRPGFDVFDRGELGSATGADDARQGFFFTDNPQAASEFTWDRGERRGAVYPVYLRIENPMHVIDFELDGAQGGMAAQIIDRARKAGHDGVIFERSRFLEHVGRTFVVFEPRQIKSALGNNGTFDRDDPNILREGEQPALDLTLTPAFRRWFRGSTIIDDNGQPLRMFRGSRHPNVEPYLKDGLIFVTAERAFAEHYARAGALHSVYVQARRPFDASRGEGYALWKTFVHETDAARYQCGGTRRGALPLWTLERELRVWLDSRGIDYDAIWFAESDGTASLAVRDIRQLKSADRNIGSFDASDPNILREDERSLTMSAQARERWLQGTHVLDEAGRPRVVYHGSRKPWITRFSLDFEETGVVSSSRRGARSGGIWFSSSRDVARYFADEAPKRRAVDQLVYGDENTWYVACLDRRGDSIFEDGPYGSRTAAAAAGREQLDLYNRTLRRNTWVHAVYLQMRNPLVLRGTVPRDREFETARAKGCDGIIAYGVCDGPTPSDIYVAFDPRQIKSAEFNRGSFDPDDPCILHEDVLDLPEALLSQQPLRDWIGSSHARTPDGAPLRVYHGTGDVIESFRGSPIWFSASPALASEYAAFRSAGAPNVIPAAVRVERPFDADQLPKCVTVNRMMHGVLEQAKAAGHAVDPDQLNDIRVRLQQCARREESGPHYDRHDFWYDSCFGSDGKKLFLEALRIAGFDGVRMTEDGAVTYGVLDAEQIRCDQALALEQSQVSAHRTDPDLSW